MESLTSVHPAESTEEASEVGECNEQSSLLSLTGKVDDLLLPYVASGDGGLQAILNLRQVCSTTKGWVDGLPLGEGRRLFRKCTVSVDLSVQSLEDFLSSPPPAGVTSLSLSLGSYSTLTKDDKVEIRHEKEEFWLSFVKLWSSKLEVLELKSTGIIGTPSFRKLCISSSAIRTFRTFRCLHSDQLGEELLKFLLQLEEIGVRAYCLKIEEKRRLYSVLSGSKNLKRFEASVYDFEDVVGITKVLDANRENSNFEAMLNFEVTFVGLGMNYGVNDPRIAQSTKLLKSIDATKTNIRLHIVEPKNRLFALVFEGQENLVTQFCERVEVMREFLEIPRLGHRIPHLTDYPNLKRLESFCCQGKSELLGRIEFPPKLEHLGVKGQLISPHLLPSSLLSLSFDDIKPTLKELWGFLSDLAQQCPRLETLKIQWTRLRGSASSSEDLQLLPTTSLTKLKSLSIEVHFPEVNPSDVVSFRKVLLDGCKVPQLPLRLFKFSLTDGKRKEGKVFDHKTLSLFLEGRVMETLLEFQLDEEATAEDALPLRLKLMAEVAANKAKREETHGRPLRL